MNTSLKIKTLYESGLSVYAVAEQIGCTQSNITYHLRKLGIKPTGHIKYSCNYTYFENIDNEHKAYWLGFICADGNIFKNNLHIGIHSKDIELLEKFKLDIEATNPIVSKTYISKGKSSNVCRIDLYNGILCDSLKAKGINENKTGRMDWGIITNNIPDDLICHFIRGYFDGDGCWKYNPNRKQATFHIIELGDSFTKNILQYLISKGLKSKAKIQSVREKFSVLEIGGLNNIKVIFDILYSNSTIHLTRKYDIVDKFIHSL